ncbi:acyl-CoA dehydrogenase [Mycobacterium koreense]|uniref:Acyl-CoA dehydrogenase n=1 Tax=Mycolicibacillus koreensis TaxID=1069220 RepID=A0A7I7SHK5_9MYCO|nr:acyl-CoA dehydrogenase family protein [Mycolicibacillus koreensis]MCV7250535.1 acyl-CoA dehydrogenase [Mycolicibacillus koreensis]ODR04829.1 acyl-CoA dehydrogenase [Mycolicibacillus koreensis]OSC32779.1 acyl-CoA dehydrogenase [Mycolicibacillus koreensis]BBY56402.1 acyl-CoA dehydrogenase [Mycolicibacillus koreensis]
MTATEFSTDLGVDPDLIAMMDGVFAEHRRTREQTGPVVGDAALWQRLDGLGLLRLTGAQESGGSGAGWPQAAELLAAAVRHGIRIPVAEHDLLACWLLETAGLPGDAAARTVCVVDGAGTARRVPWASAVDRVVVVWRDGADYRLADLDVDDRRVQISRGVNLIGEPRDDIGVETAALTGAPVAPAAVHTLGLKSALVRSVQVCAAMDAALALVVEYTSQRLQFGRPVSKFQAVQHMVADIAAEAALARAATEAALAAAVASEWAPDKLDKLEFLVAAARSCTGHAASTVTRNAHQAVGAIGTTREHRLPEFTRAALAWRSEFGSVRSWDARLTDAALAAGPAGLWSLIAD